MQININIDIIIPTLNRPKALFRTLSCIEKNKLKPESIIIVNQTQDLNIRLQYQNVIEDFQKTLNIKHIFQDEPSLTKARNLGLKHAKSEIIICMDDDVDIKNNTLLEIQNIFKNTDIALLGGLDEKDIHKKNSKLSYYLGYLFYKKSYFKRNIGHVTFSVFGRFPNSYERQIINTEWAMGFFFVIRNSIVQKFQLKWDEKLIGYGYAEDLDFSYRYYQKCILINKRCIFDTKILVNHLATQEWRTPTRKETFMFIMNRLYLSYKLFKQPILPRIYFYWTNIGLLIERIFKGNYKDLLWALSISLKYRKQIKKGEIPYNLL